MSSASSPNPRENALFYLIKLLARRSAVYGLFDFLGRATSMILVPLYATRLNAVQFGTMEILTVTQSLLVGVLVLGLNSALVRFHTTSSDDRERAGYFRTAFTLVASVAAPVTVVLVALAEPLSRLIFGSADYAGLWQLVFLTVLLDSLLQIFLALFRSEEKPFTYSWVNLGRFVSTLVLNVVLVGFLDRGVPGAIAGNLAGTGLGFLLGLWFARDVVRFELHRARMARLTAFGFSILAHPLAMFVVNNSDRFLLKMYRGVGEVGVYALGYKIGLVLSLVVNAFLITWQPLVYRIGREEGAPAIFSRILTYYLLVGGFIVVGISSFSTEIVDLISNPEYSRAAGFVWLILLSYLLQGVYYVFSAGITVVDRIYWFSIVVVIGAVVNVVANLLLIPRFGIWGAAWSTLLSFVTLSAAMFVVSQRHFPIRYEVRRALILVFVGTAALVLNAVVIGHGSFPRIVFKILVLVAFPFALHLLDFFSREELLRGRLLIQRRTGRAG